MATGRASDRHQETLLDRTAAYLRDFVATWSTSHPGTRFPGVRALARSIRVSHVTLLRALGRLREEGRIAVVPGQGVWPAGAPGDRPAGILAEPPRGTKGDGLAVHLRREVLTGVYPAGRPLPNVKTLRQRYGVSYETLARALRLLVKDGTLVGYGAGCRVPALAAPRDSPGGAGGRHARVVFVTGGERPWPVTSDDKRFDALLRALEAECVLAGLELQRVCYNERDRCFMAAPGATARVPGDPEWTLGYLVFSSGIGDGSALLGKLMPLARPIAVLTTGDALVIPAGSGGTLVRTFETGPGPGPGADMGRYLLCLGHRRVAYLSPYHAAQWSRERWDGLAGVYRAAGMTGAVVPCVDEYFADDRDYLVAARNRKSTGTYLNRALLRRHTPRPLHARADELEESLWRLLRDCQIYPALSRLFAQALADKAVTAWVACTDYIALMALEFLRGRGVCVPQDISVVGFDDLEVVSVRADLTTYRYNMQAVVQQMLRHVLQPRYRPLRDTPGIVRIGGMIVERGTTAPAR